MTRPPVVGIDLSLTSTGIAVVHPDGCVVLETVTSTGRAAAKLEDRHERLRTIVHSVLSYVPMYALVVIESPSLGQGRQAGQLDRHGLWWLTVDTLRLNVVVDVTPASRCKYATGVGNAPKDAVLAAAVRRFPDVPVNGNDTADALWLAAMGCEHLSEPIVDLPATHRAAMTGVRWPELDAVSR
jgi:crossover junction endodeoxyribonuclease RuvC